MSHCPVQASCFKRNHLTLIKAKLLGNAFIDSQFNYTPLIWMFSDKTTYLKMQKIHHKTLKVIYQSDASYDDLLHLSNSVSLHQRDLRGFLMEIYRNTGTSNTERSHMTWDGIQYFSFHHQDLQFMVLILGSLIWSKLLSLVKSSR